ncbi:hypothetical protein F0562_025152 [Nyssa sinensis]|uniref:Protein kinase domain-containing protein n=1 Tax=Nyssa sinensis TaxID=561372 RepID=A0A5J5BJC5_9ASTE|nr:hypothetical protein F0562_025152 [Nyssa sinensis]
MGFLSGLFACLVKKGLSAGGGEEQADDGGEPWNFFFELQVLQMATDFFSYLNRIGQRGFGNVYKGLMPNGQVVAVKKLSVNSQVTQFINEVKLLLKIQHKNLVMLLGCCAEGPEKILVYEYVPNKSLDCFLFDKKKFPSLDWPERFRMVSGVARGLLYLHEEAPERIIHRDIKASNILLDEQLHLKISDFGPARLFPGKDIYMSVDTIAGTIGYTAPEYLMEGYLSVKTDVFSFGVLVLEIVSGRRNYDRFDQENGTLLSYAWMLFQEGKTLELVDPSLDNYNPDQVAMCIQLGLLCCQRSVAERPDMSSVHLMLLSNPYTLPTPRNPGAGSIRSRNSISENSMSENSISCSTMDEGR